MGCHVAVAWMSWCRLAGMLGAESGASSATSITRSKALGGADGLPCFFAEWLALSPFGMPAFPADGGRYISSLSRAELVFDVIRAMRRRHMDLEAERHLVITNWAVHKLRLS